jgi:DnaJ-class molecular chaperone
MYSVLGVQHTAKQEEIRSAFNRLAKELHPDVNPSSAAAAQFTRVKEAYDALRDPAKRAIYDKRLAHETATGYDPELLRKRAEEFRRNYQRE